MLKRKKLLPLDRYGFWARGTIGELSAEPPFAHQHGNWATYE